MHTREEFDRKVREFLAGPYAAPWPGIRLGPSVTNNPDEDIWMQEADCDDGPLPLILYHGEIYVEEC